MQGTTKWHITGDYFESCNCDSACPCVFQSRPTQGYCHSLQAYRITRGHYGELDLSGLTAVQVLMTDGHFWRGQMELVLYIEEKASAPQRDALEAIFTGRAGGPYKFPGRLIKKVQKVEYVPMESEIQAGQRRFRIPGVMDFTLVALDCHNPDGRPTEIRGSMHFLDPVYVARAIRSWFRGHGQSWDHSGRSGFYGTFDLEGP